MEPEITAAEPRWRRRKGDRPVEILDAAARVFGERGFAAARLDDVAAEAGVTKGTIYLYYKSKQELLKAVVRHFIIDQVSGRERDIAESDAPTADILRNIFSSFGFLKAQAPQPVLAKLIIAEAQNFPDLARFYVEEVLVRSRQQIRGLLERGIIRGEFRPVDTRYAYFSFIGPVFAGTVWRTVFQPYDSEPLDLRKVFEIQIDMLLHGVLKNPQTSSKEL